MKIYTYEGKANISGDRIHQARTAQRLSQDALAAKLQLAGLSIGREAVSRIETGLRFVTDYELVIFARVLGVTIEWLTGDMQDWKRLAQTCACLYFFAHFYFLTPPYFFRPAQGEVKKRPHTYPPFALSNPQS